MVNVLIVDDSPISRDLLTFILKSDPEINIIGTATDGLEAIKAVEKLKPDVITMDIQMPNMDGIEATRRIMETSPTPIIIVSGNLNNRDEVSSSFDYLNSGAVAVFAKPGALTRDSYIKESGELIRSIKAMSEVKVIKRTKRISREDIPESLSAEKGTDISVVVMGASTGGPMVLQQILMSLKTNLPFPILIVQHISPGFIEGFADWLSKTTGHNIKIAEDEEIAKEGVVYIAPDNYHMTIQKNLTIKLLDGDESDTLKPSVSMLFKSAADNYGHRAAAVLLSGMGKDGAEELKTIKEKNGLTIVQDKASCVVYGMPGEAVKLNAHMYQLLPERIALLLNDLAERKKNK